MTAAEIAAMEQETYKAQKQERETVPELSDDDKIRLYVQSIPVSVAPSLKPKVGYKWKAVYSGAAGFAWELVEDPTAVGTMKNPMRWADGFAVGTGLHYTDGTTTYVALEDGVPSGFDDVTYFAGV